MKRFLWSAAVAAAAATALAAPSRVLAQDAPTTAPAVVVADEPEAYDPNPGALTLTGGVDWTTAYFFRGYNQEDQGLIFQPYVTVTTALATSDSFTLNGYVGTWNSLQSEKTGAAATGPDTWYESDLFGGLDFVFGKFTIGTVYTYYTYPNGAFNTIQEVGFKVAYDDTEFMKDKLTFALKPYAAVYIETSDGNGTEDTYLELGISPSFSVGKFAGHGVTLSVPIVVGCSLDDYYLDDGGDNEFLGYTSVGLFASIPLGENTKYGTWTLTGGVQWLQLYADSVEAVNHGEESEILGKVGASFAY